MGDIVKSKIGSIETEKGEVKFIEEDSNKSTYGCYNSLALVSREERAALLKTGLTGRDIESLYLKFNEITVIGINWQDLNSKEPS